MRTHTRVMTVVLAAIVIIKESLEHLQGLQRLRERYHVSTASDRGKGQATSWIRIVKLSDKATDQLATVLASDGPGLPVGDDGSVQHVDSHLGAHRVDDGIHITGEHQNVIPCKS